MPERLCYYRPSNTLGSSPVWPNDAFCTASHIPVHAETAAKSAVFRTSLSPVCGAVPTCPCVAPSLMPGDHPGRACLCYPGVGSAASATRRRPTRQLAVIVPLPPGCFKVCARQFAARAKAGDQGVYRSSFFCQYSRTLRLTDRRCAVVYHALRPPLAEAAESVERRLAMPLTRTRLQAARPSSDEFAFLPLQ